MGREGERGGDAEQAMRRAALDRDLLLDGLDRAHDPPRGFIEGLALGREMERPGRTLQQADAQPRF